MLSLESSLTLQPMALADSRARVMFSLSASFLCASEAVEEILVRARRSTVFGTDLLTSLLCVCGGVVWYMLLLNNCLHKGPCSGQLKNGSHLSQLNEPCTRCDKQLTRGWLGWSMSQRVPRPSPAAGDGGQAQS